MLRVVTAEDIGSRVRQLRDAAGYTQERLGAEAFPDKAPKAAELMVSRLETGIPQSPNYNRMVAVATVLASALQVDPGETMRYIAAELDELAVMLRPRLRLVGDEAARVESAIPVGTKGR